MQLNVEVLNNAIKCWTELANMITHSQNNIEIFPVSTVQSTDTLQKLPIASIAELNSIILHTGGISIDNGWLRILGSGSLTLPRSIYTWNINKTFTEDSSPKLLYIADDVLGGFFTLNLGGLGNDVGIVYYLAPDTLEYESLDMTYLEFINFCCNGNIEQFYQDFRWSGWEKDVLLCSCDQAYSFYPFLWTKEARDMNQVSRRPVSIEEIFTLQQDFRKQLRIP